MLLIGITGGIGSGKTTACKVFELLGIPVYYADTRSKEILNENAQIKQEIKSLFGDCIYDDKGLDRKKLAQIVFNDHTKLKALEAISHPAVKADFKEWVATKSEYPYLLKEAALLYESDSYKELDYIITVHAPNSESLKRVIKRDGVSEDAIKARMANQWDNERKKEMAQFVIDNDGKQLIIPQIIHLHQQLISLSAS
jgi:dephospho-CoA kinase